MNITGDYIAPDTIEHIIEGDSSIKKSLDFNNSPKAPVTILTEHSQIENQLNITGDPLMNKIERRPVISRKLTRTKSLTINEQMHFVKKKFYIRKNQFDITASLVYGLNVSLVHITLLVMILFAVKFPDVEKAAKYDEAFTKIGEKGLSDLHT